MTHPGTPRDVLHSTIRELCSSDDVDRCLLKNYETHISVLAVEDFPADLRTDYWSLCNELAELGTGSPSEDSSTSSHPTKNTLNSIINSLIDLYSNLQSHRAPYVDKESFLDRANRASPNPYDSDQTGTVRDFPGGGVLREYP